jgi:hypothetical protein
MERRVNPRSAGHADAFGNCLAKLFCDVADGALASNEGWRQRKNAARTAATFIHSRRAVVIALLRMWAPLPVRHDRGAISVTRA